MNIVGQIRCENRERHGHLAVAEGKLNWTYGQIFSQVSALGAQLRELGIGPGARVGFRCGDGAAFIVGSLALLEIGAAIVPVDASLSAHEVAETMRRIDVHGVLFKAGTFTREAADKEVRAGEVEFKFVWRRRDVMRDTAPEMRACAAISAAFIRFSSGTTGASKGVVLSHQSIFERTEAANEGLRISANDRILWVLQMSHHFVVSILLFLRKGATIIIAHRDFPMSIVDTAARESITFIYASPFHYHLLAGNNAVKPSALRNVRLAISTAMKLPAATARNFAEKFGFGLAEAYGIIEVGLPFINLAAGDGSPGTVGRILPAYEMRLENSDTDGVGHVSIRGKGMFDAYFSPWQSQKDALEDGWFRTGDLGWLDSNGNLRIVGREKSVIICAGMKIFPNEVEEVLNAHPDVLESLVYGREHPVYGQTPEAEIVRAFPDDSDAAEFKRSLRRHCYNELSSYKVPKSFTIVKSLPRTVSGKLLRR